MRRIAERACCGVGEGDPVFRGHGQRGTHVIDRRGGKRQVIGDIFKGAGRTAADRFGAGGPLFDDTIDHDHESFAAPFFGGREVAGGFNGQLIGRKPQVEGPAGEFLFGGEPLLAEGGQTGNFVALDPHTDEILVQDPGDFRVGERLRFHGPGEFVERVTDTEIERFGGGLGASKGGFTPRHPLDLSERGGDERREGEGREKPVASDHGEESCGSNSRTGPDASAVAMRGFWDEERAGSTITLRVSPGTINPLADGERGVKLPWPSP